MLSIEDYYSAIFPVIFCSSMSLIDLVKGIHEELGFGFNRMDYIREC